MPPESSAIDLVSREVGISVAMLERWRADALPNGSGVDSPRWTATVRLQAVIVTATMDEATRTAWCHEHGLYPTELDGWKRDAIAGLGEPACGQCRRGPRRSAAGQGVGAGAASQGQGAGRNGCFACAVKNRMARPVCKGDSGWRVGLHQRIRSQGLSPGQDGFRALGLINIAVSSTTFLTRLPGRRSDR